MFNLSDSEQYARKEPPTLTAQPLPTLHCILTNCTYFCFHPSKQLVHFIKYDRRLKVTKEKKKTFHLPIDDSVISFRGQKNSVRSVT